MEIIYDWLLHNTGNEGNYFTILNAQRHIENGKTIAIEVMARTKEFAIINLVIKSDSPINLPNRILKETHFFADDDQVINYLREGKTTNVESSQQGIGIYVFVPTSDSDELIFPPQQ